MVHYSIESRTKKYFKGYGYLSFAQILSNKYEKQLLDTGIGCLKTASKKQYIKQVNFAEAITNSYDDKIVKTKPVEEIFIPPEKKRRSNTQIKTNIVKMKL